jgi:hypothetical protein
MSTTPPAPANDLGSDLEVGGAAVESRRKSAKRRRLGVLAAVLLCLVGTGAYFKWNAVHASSITRSASAALTADGIAVIETNAEPVDSDSPFQGWSKPKIVRIQSSGKQITDADLHRIAVISEDLNLVLTSCPITNDGLASLEGKNNVRCLSLSRTAVSDDGIQHLRGMNLQSLDLSGTKVTDAGLATLAEFDCPRLKEIALENTGVTDVGLTGLGKFKSLEWVSVAGTKVTKDGIRRLRAKLPDVVVLK